MDPFSLGLFTVSPEKIPPFDYNTGGRKIQSDKDLTPLGFIFRISQDAFHR